MSNSTTEALSCRTECSFISSPFIFVLQSFSARRMISIAFVLCAREGQWHVFAGIMLHLQSGFACVHFSLL